MRRWKARSSSTIADAFYAPVVMRFKTYGVALAPALQAYCDRVLAHPAVARWVERSAGRDRGDGAEADADELPE
jgi:glutathione S-transferase